MLKHIIGKKPIYRLLLATCSYSRAVQQSRVQAKPSARTLTTKNSASQRSEDPREHERAAQLPSLSCWKCERVIDLSGGEAKFLCPCAEKVILPPTASNYFHVMNCPVSFEVDLDHLRTTYKSLQWILHPDKFANSSEKEKRFSEEQSSLVNKAYSTLIKPHSRGLYLLGLHGEQIDEKDNTAGDPTFLEEVMEANEELSRAPPPPPSRLRDMQELNNKKLKNCVSELARFFKNGDISNAKEALARMKYFLNIEKDLVEMLDVP